MEPKSKINEVYNLLSDILGIVGRYSPDVFHEAIEHVDLTAKGMTREVLLKVIEELERLVKEPVSDASDSAEVSTPEIEPATPEKKATPAPKKAKPSKPATPAPKKAKPSKPAKPSPKKAKPSKLAKPSPKKTKPAPKPITPVPAESDSAQEVKQILENTEFLPEKQDVLKVIQKHFAKTVTIRPDNKDSRRDLTNKAVSAFRKMNKSRQRTIHSALKRAYKKK